MSPAAPVRVFHCDDSAGFRLLVGAMLGDRADVEVVGEAASVEEAVERLPALAADVVLADRVVDDAGELVERLREAAPGARIVLYSGMPEAAGAGADASVSKDAAFDELHRVVLEVAGRA